MRRIVMAALYLDDNCWRIGEFSCWTAQNDHERACEWTLFRAFSGAVSS